MEMNDRKKCDLKKLFLCCHLLVNGHEINGLWLICFMNDIASVVFVGHHMTNIKYASVPFICITNSHNYMYCAEIVTVWVKPKICNRFAKKGKMFYSNVKDLNTM